MRKSFTLLLSTLMLLCVFGYSSFAAAPELASAKPSDGAMNVKTSTTDLVVKFNQDVKFTTTGGTLIVWRGSTAIKSVALVSGNAKATIAADSLVVKHDLTLIDNTTYSVTISDNAIENAGGEPFAGITAGNWEFTTGDYTVPVVDELAPADNDANVDVKATPFNLVITFEDANNILSVDEKKIWLYSADGTVVDIINISDTNPIVTGKTATFQFNPIAFSEEVTEYYVNVQAGAFTDLNGNEFAGIMDNTTWTFTSRDYTAPYVETMEVTNVSDESATLNVTTSEAGSVWYAYTTGTVPTYPGDYAEVATGAGNAVSVSLTGLTNDTEYTVYIVAENADEDYQPVASSVKFKTLDTTPAQLIGVDPDLAAGVKVTLDQVFTLTFDEDVQFGDDLIFEIKYAEHNEDTENWEMFEFMSEYNITINGNVVIIDPFQTLAYSTRYLLTVTSASLEDLSGNGFWYQHNESVVRSYFSRIFTTIDEPDVTAPVPTFSPYDGETGILTTESNLSITFDKNIVLLDGSAVDNSDLVPLVYVRKGTEDIAHTATITDANIINITLNEDLEAGAEYIYGFEAAFMDAAENEVGARSATFTVEPAEAIVIITFVPDNNEIAPTTITVDQDLRIIFNGELNTYSIISSENNIPVTPTYLHGATAGNGAITLKQGITDEDVPFTASIESRTEDETVIVITPNSDLASTTTYTLAVVADKLQLGVGNSTILGSTKVKSINYITEDVVEPVALTFYPAKGGTAPLAGIMSIAFNENVMIDTEAGSIEIREAAGPIALSIDASQLNVKAGDPKVIEITPLSVLTEGEEYFVIIPAGVITDISGNAWEGISVAYEWDFTISEVPAAPQVMSSTPHGTNVPVTTDLRIVFDRPVQLGTTGYVAIYTADGIAAELIRVTDGASQFTIVDTVVTINIAHLEQYTTFEVEIAAGTFATSGHADLIYSGITRGQWTFRTESNEPPALVSLTPAVNSNSVNLRTVAEMVFELDVKAGTGDITLRRGSDSEIVHAFDVNSDEVTFEGNVVTFSLEGLLEANSTEYYIIVPEGAITNIAQIPLSYAGLGQMTSWNFTTYEDGVAPELVTWSPDEVEIEGLHTDFVMEFDEDVTLTGAVNLVVTEVGSTQPVLEIPVTEAMISGNIITVTYDVSTYGELKYESEYYVTIAGDIIEDLSENRWAGVTDATAWTFTTKDRTVTIAEIQGTGHTSPMVGEIVRVIGTVTGISLGEGFFMQDANAAWSGLWVEYGNAGSLSVGQGVVIIGEVDELSDVTTVFASEVETVVAPLTVQPIVLNSPAAVKAEMYEAVLVQVLDATGSATDAGYIWSISYDAINKVGVSGWLYQYTSVEGHLYDVTGIVNARMSNYRLTPRMASDINHYMPIANIQGTGNVSPLVGVRVYVNATVTAIAAGEGFFMQDASEAWSGIWVQYGNVANLSIGDGVKVVGTVSETAEVTTIDATSVTSIDAPATIVPVIVNSPAAAKAEMYESVLVQVNGARATAANAQNVWDIHYEAINKIAVNRWLYLYTPVAQHYYNVTGVINARMSNYRLEPRMESDIYDITVETDVNVISAADYKVYPNPFNDVINIDNSDKLSRVVITNIAGQRVMDVQYPERTISTSRLVSGVYVVSLFTEDGIVKSDRIVKR